MPVRATSSPKIALIKVDLPTPVLPKIARLNRPSDASCLSYSARNESRNQSWLPAMAASLRVHALWTSQRESRYGRETKKFSFGEDSHAYQDPHHAPHHRWAGA